MADDPKPLSAPTAVTAFGKALGRDLPASLANVRALGAQLRGAASPTTTKKKGG